MPKYRVKAIVGAPSRRPIDSYDVTCAENIRHIYGLTMFSVADIIEIWRNYSDRFWSVGWAHDTSEDVERAFGVKLEEITENLE